MSNRPRPSSPSERRHLTRRQITAQQREANLQRRVVLILGSVLGLALLLIVAGLVYDRLYLPNRAVRQVNEQTLTRGEYETVLRDTTIDQIAQLLQFSRIFGASQSFGQGGSFAEQVVQANVALTQIGTSRSRQQPVDESLVDQWTEQQLIDQRAQAEFQINPSEGEINQALVNDLGSILQSSDPLTGTDSITATTTTTDTSELGTAVADETATTDEATATGPTATAQPTATPGVDEANAQSEQIIDALYDEYTNILSSQAEEAPEEQRTAQMTRDELAAALRDQYRQQLVRERVEAALVPEVPADAETEFIRARHILLRVPEPEAEASAAPEAEASAAPDATAAASAEPSASPSPSPEELEQLFNERQAEAQQLVEQLRANPDSFEEVAREQSEDEATAAQGGDLGTFDREGNPPEGQQSQTPIDPALVEAAWALEDNAISDPIRTASGWHIIQRLPEDPEQQLQRLQTEAFENWLNEQRATATIIPAPTPTATELPTEPAEELPADGSAAPDAEASPEGTTTP